jgi:uncharacterized membrane protein
VSKNTGETEGRISFTLAGALAGARRCVPIAISGCGIGLVFGTLAGQAGLGAGEAVLMSALVFSGAAQFVVLGLWAVPLPVATIVLATLVVGLRHVLMGAALAPVFSKLPRLKAYGSVFFMLWLASRFDLSERAGAWLDQIPGAILVSLVAPTILMGGPVEVFAALVVVIVSLRTGSLPAAMVTGVGTVLALRALETNLL